MGTKLVYLNRRRSRARGILVTSRLHEFLSKRSELLIGSEATLRATKSGATLNLTQGSFENLVTWQQMTEYRLKGGFFSICVCIHAYETMQIYSGKCGNYKGMLVSNLFYINKAKHMFIRVQRNFLTNYRASKVKVFKKNNSICTDKGILRFYSGKIFAAILIRSNASRRSRRSYRTLC